ncbi:MAG: ribose-5-phosphate isomerase RpiA [Gammaproteobacteria bacterium]|nr:ribose-5-phosphate isomerase RpiA [Gammaproteobacteria bacterium]
MSNETLKQQVAAAALEYVVYDTIIGVGTGSTVNYFIPLLAKIKHKIEGAVSSSAATEKLLKQHGIPVFDLNTVDRVSVYIDGADEVNHHRQMIKGGGAALTREKIVAASSEKFICIVDQSKVVDVLGKFPLPIEVIPMARGYVARQLLKMDCDPNYREGVITDNGNIILDAHGLSLLDPVKSESEINNITGVVTNGIFARRPADVVLVANTRGIEII